MQILGHKCTVIEDLELSTISCASTLKELLPCLEKAVERNESLRIQLEDGEPLILTQLAGIRSGEINEALREWFNNLFAGDESLPYQVVSVQKLPRPALRYQIRIAVRQ
jgi:hypothetical protein